MLVRERPTAMPIRTINSISKWALGGLEARKALCFKVGNKSIQSERDKAIFESYGTNRECL
jgi:hypothetical protein